MKPSMQNTTLDNFDEIRCSSDEKYEFQIYTPVIVIGTPRPILHWLIIYFYCNTPFNKLNKDINFV